MKFLNALKNTKNLRGFVKYFFRMIIILLTINEDFFGDPKRDNDLNFFIFLGGLKGVQRGYL